MDWMDVSDGVKAHAHALALAASPMIHPSPIFAHLGVTWMIKHSIAVTSIGCVGTVTSDPTFVRLACTPGR